MLSRTRSRSRGSPDFCGISCRRRWRSLSGRTGKSMLWTVRAWYDVMLPRAGGGWGGCVEEGFSWADCEAGNSEAMICRAMISSAKSERAEAGTAQAAASVSAAKVVSNACLKRKPAPQRGYGRLSVSMNGCQAMLYWARETERHL